MCQCFLFAKLQKIDDMMHAMNDKKSKNPCDSEEPQGITPKWALTDSNRRPSACKADALNQLS